jgi:hypothetical protein
MGFDYSEATTVREVPKFDRSIVAYGLATGEPCKTDDPILDETASKFPGIKVAKAKMHVPGRCGRSRRPTRLKLTPRRISSRTASFSSPAKAW